MVMIFIVSGCAPLGRTKTVTRKMPMTMSQEAVTPATPQKPENLFELANMEQEDMERFVSKKGVVFAKTDFQGVLNTNDVTFFLEDTEDTAHQFQLHIAPKSPHSGYFFIELPAGRYKISSISIPVGSTTATEESHIYFEVTPDTIAYLGTLSLVGLKEKIKLGGVPVIKPGFEYSVQIIDEHDEGILVFQQQYPHISLPIQVKLMDIKP